MVKEDVNLAILDQAGPIADAESRSSEFQKSKDVEDAGGAISQGDMSFVLVVWGELRSCEVGR